MKILYINDLFNEFEFKIINNVLIINDTLYCCETDYLEIYSIASCYKCNPKKYKKILHIIYACEQQIELYLDKSRHVINCESNPPTIKFSNDKVYATKKDFIKNIKYKTHEDVEYGLYRSPKYIFG